MQIKVKHVDLIILCCCVKNNHFPLFNAECINLDGENADVVNDSRNGENLQEE